MKAPIARPAPSPWQLQRVVALAQSTIDSLRHDHGVILDTDKAIADALAEEQVDVDKVLRRLIEAQRQAKAMAKIASDRKADLDVRIARYKRQDASLRQTIIDVMDALNVTSWPDPEFGLSTRPGESKLVISDGDAIPDHLTFEIPARKEPDLARVKAALEAGEDVPGASLSNGPTILTIRTK